MKMIRSDNPQIDVEWLMDNFREEVRRKKRGVRSSGLDRPFLDTSRIDALISAIESSSRPRTHFPNALRRFPFTWSQWLQRFVLKTLALLFRDQQMINMSIAYLLREMKSYNTRIVEQLMQRQDSLAQKLENLSEEQRHINSAPSKVDERYPMPR
jgi:hypothetical protein